MQAFPAYRYDGDKDAAAALRLVAQNLLHQARLIDRVSPSRITKLNRVSPFGTVEVLIIEGQEYVNIFGAPRFSTGGKKKASAVFRALSGLIRGGGIVEVDGAKKVRDYRPTLNAFETSLGSAPGKEPEIFHDEELLVDSSLLGGCQFSGLMAKMVQLVSGFAKLEVDGELKIDPEGGIFTLANFQSNYFQCHGLVRLQETVWLVEISYLNGIMAMKLPMLDVRVVNEDEYEPGEVLQIVKSDATDECERLFGGIPSGRGFPVAAALTKAIEDGDVLRLQTADYMAAYFDSLSRPNRNLELVNGQSTDSVEPYSVGMGWSFSLSGREAHNTQYRIRTTAVPAFNGGPLISRAGLDARALHQKIVFTGGDDELGAQLMLVSDDAIHNDVGLSNYYFDGEAVHVNTRHPNFTLGQPFFTNPTMLVFHRGDQLCLCKQQSRGFSLGGGNDGIDTGNTVYVEGVSAVATQETAFFIIYTGTGTLGDGTGGPGGDPNLVPVPAGTAFTSSPGARPFQVDGADNYVDYRPTAALLVFRLFGNDETGVGVRLDTRRENTARVFWTGSARDAIYMRSSSTELIMGDVFGNVFQRNFGAVQTAAITPDQVINFSRPASNQSQNIPASGRPFATRPLIFYSTVGDSPHVVAPVSEFYSDVENEAQYPTSIYGYVLSGNLFAGEPSPARFGNKYSFIGFI